ncbi:uncharacterized protein TRIADDRAFT_53222 [Trichoplax adhaerens]|uniref:RAP domain-containing protein n=1 Tax=Trichoplax adhaerens TaxID=10228 RepID=B3RNM8_TRIAD|nr:hypothetical protein TRIADDRAFT_53222 [Trichoplax adhaerens]EDV27484.1 hypothetical protein TRIADDRAFT_53222 [Trichoplax adhaerens]|eukprot:XP_002109318.1 hypothetical protein TRIADDRAFT_53222 [Trichoplax adhaerens]
MLSSRLLLLLLARRGISAVTNTAKYRSTIASYDSTMRCLTSVNKYEFLLKFYPRTLTTDLFQDSQLHDELQRLTNCASILQFIKRNKQFYDPATIVLSFSKLRHNMDNSYSLYNQKDFQNLCQLTCQKLTLLNDDEFISLSSSLAGFINKNRFITDKSVMRLFIDIHTNAAQRYPSFSNSQLSHMAWCLIQYSTIPKLNNKLYLNQLVAVVEKRVTSFNNPVHIANLMWALSKDQLNIDIFQQLQQQAINNINKFNPISISMVCYSLALFGDRSEQLLTAIENRMLAIINLLDPQSIANIAWAFAKLNWFNDEIFGFIQKRTLDNIGKRTLRPQSISNIIWAFASMNYDDQQLFTAGCLHFLHNHQHYNIDDLCQLIYSLGKMNFKLELPASKKFFPIVIQRLEDLMKRQNRYTPKFYKQVISATWSLIIMEQFPPRLISKILSDQFIEDATPYISQIEATQLYQIDLATILESGDSSIQCLSPVNKRKFVQAFCAVTTSLSSLEQNVVPAIHQFVGGDRYYRLQVATPFGYSIDIELLLDKDKNLMPINEILPAATSTGDNIEMKITNLITKVVTESMTHLDYERIAIEIDGPVHFAYKSNRYLGHTIMKTRHLSLLGWHVIRVPYYEWNKLNDLPEIDRYLKEKLFQQ